MSTVPPRRSPVPGLLVGLVVTLLAVVAYSYYTTRQLTRLRTLQTDLLDRNRRASLQLLRIQNNLNLLGLAMRDMLDADQPYPLTSWQGSLRRIRTDLDDALQKERALAGSDRVTAGQDPFADSLSQFWGAVDRMFVAAASQPEDARSQIRVTLQARQASLSTAVSRLLVENNTRDEEAAQSVQAIYDQVQRQVYWFFTATLIAILATSFYVMRANRRLFAELALLSEGRRELAQQMIATRETTLRHLSRELHDELGQVLTAMGTILGRAEKQMPEGAPLRADLHDLVEAAQRALTNVRGLSQALHPSILEELGLESAIEWYLTTVEKQLNLAVSYERIGGPVTVDAAIGIQIYRVLQEALNNVAKHSGAREAAVRLRRQPGQIELEVEDHGSGLDARTSGRGLGLVAMRERAELVGGSLMFGRPTEGGTIVRLRVPLEELSHAG
jgi:signal transduction histidine kinase